MTRLLTPAWILRMLVACAALCAAGCGGGSARSAPSLNAPTPAPTAAAAPFAAPAGIWTWFDFPASTCSDGSPTGIGVNPGSGPDLVIFFNGGGACWNATTCLVLDDATNGPYGKTQFTAAAAKLTGSILDRALANNPLATASLVMVPYCTGDLHAGANVASYADASGTIRHYHHAGHLNVLAYLARIAATWPAPRKLIIAGSSAGGYGALFNYDTIRARFAAGETYLIDDSGPPLPNGAVPASEMLDIFTDWNLGALLDPLCACRSGFEPALAALIQRYPGDRMSLLSSEQDQTIRSYAQLSAAGFQQALNQTAAEVLAPATNGRYFFIAGQSHTMLGHPAAVTETIPLLTWLTQEVTDAPAWTNESPPS